MYAPKQILPSMLTLWHSPTQQLKIIKKPDEINHLYKIYFNLLLEKTWQRQKLQLTEWEELVEQF